MADIELVIKIPKHLYKLLKDLQDLPSDSNEGTIENVLMKAVENGTPLEQIRNKIEQNIGNNPYKNDGIYCSLHIIDKYRGDKNDT